MCPNSQSTFSSDFHKKLCLGQQPILQSSRGISTPDGVKIASQAGGLQPYILT